MIINDIIGFTNGKHDINYIVKSTEIYPEYLYLVAVWATQIGKSMSVL